MNVLDGSRLKVLLISHRFPGDGAGGTEVLTADIADALVDRGHAVSWLAAGRAPADCDQRITFIPLEPSFGVDYPARWRKHEDQVAADASARLTCWPAPDVVHMTHLSRVGLRLLDRPPLTTVPVVATLTDYTPICPDHQLWVRSTQTQCSPHAPATCCLGCVGLPDSAVGEVVTWRRRNIDWLNQRVRAFWTQTPHQARQLEEAGISTTRLVSDQARYDLPAAWAQVEGSGHASDYVLFAGRISPEKGLHVLIDAFLEWSGDLRLAVVGDADDVEYARQLRVRTAHDPRIEWHGPVVRNDMARWIRSARAVLVPSQWQENHPIIADEARGLGVPVYCSGVSSLQHLGGAPGVHLVSEHQRPDSWIEVLDVLADDGLTPRPSQVHELRQSFAEFVDDVITVYQRQVSA